MKKWLTAGVLGFSLLVGAANMQASAAFDGYGLQVSREQWSKINQATN